MHLGHLLTRAALRYPDRPAWLERDTLMRVRVVDDEDRRGARPREIEEVICRHPAVFEVAVIGVPDDRWGESVKALVVPRQGARITEAEIIEHCRRSIASYKKPRSVEFVPELPKNAYGKILKRALRERDWAEHARNV